jgi:U3 small nucleolar RNA-associated protein 12
VTKIIRCADKETVAVGYSTGNVCIFNYISKTLVATLHGHRSAVTSFAVDSSGTYVASGGADGDIFVWDMLTMTALCRIKAHKDVVTGVEFLYRGTQRLLVSVSKDTLLKVWDVDSHQCLQTIVGHRCEIWAVKVSSSGRVYTGCTDEYIRGYRLAGPGDDENDDDDHDRENNAGMSNNNAKNESNESNEENVLQYYGSIHRSSSGGGSLHDKCASLSLNPTETLLAAQTNGKTVEFFHIRDGSIVKKKMKRRLKRQREKGNKEGKGAKASNDDSGAYSMWESTEPVGGEDSTATGGVIASRLEGIDSSREILSDELEYWSSIRCGEKIRGFAFSPKSGASVNTDMDGEGAGLGEDKALVSLITNAMEVFSIPTPLAGFDLAALTAQASKMQSALTDTSATENTNTSDSSKKSKKKALEEGESQKDSPTVDLAALTSPAKVSVIDLHGHRSDVRAVAISADSLSIASCSNEGVKVCDDECMRGFILRPLHFTLYTLHCRL